MEESDDDLFAEEPIEPPDQDGPDLFGQDGPVVEDLPVDAIEPPVEPGPHRRSEQEVTASLMEVVDALRQPPHQVSRPDTPLALYRRYRPDTFADVIGQEHVTEPLQRALTNNRVNHAYLFSGPRGLRQDHLGPHPGPLPQLRRRARPRPRAATCQSCTDLARGGSGSIDVIEIDAASPTVASTTPATCASGRSSPRSPAATRSTSSTRRTWSPPRASTPC